MLVLTRKVEESIMIAENVVVTVLSVSGGKVRLGVQAPREVPVVRKEVSQPPPPIPSR
jgi:carbon storage regulator